MNSLTLESVIKLFAISVNRASEDSDDLVIKCFSDFLNKYVEEKYINSNIERFRTSLTEFSSFRSVKKTSLNSVRIISICEELKSKLSMSERIQVLFFLLELAKASNNSRQSTEFILLISEMFGVSSDIFAKLKYLMNSNDNTDFTPLVYEKEVVAVMFCTDYGIIFIKPLVEGVRQDGIPAGRYSVFMMFKESVLAYGDIKKFFYPELISLIENKDNVSRFKLIISELELNKRKKTLLHKFSLTLQSGEFVGIIGKSGSGKTSLLRCLSGNERNYKGSILFRREAEPGLLQKSYVPQYDNFIPLFTIEEHLRQRCNFLQIPVAEQDEIIDKTLHLTDLNGDRNKRVCKTDNSPFEVSGGQQKRLSIAMELPAEPDVLILDEPTSGLSSEDSYKIISLLKKISASNKIVVASVHQPDFDIFLMFDKILVIDEGGYPVYFGTPVKAVDYFREKTGKINKNSLVETRYNPSVLLKLIDEKKYNDKGRELLERVVSPQDYYNWFRESNPPLSADSGTAKTAERKQNGVLSFLNQFKLSIKVDLKIKYRIFLQLLVPLLTGSVFSFLARYSDSESYSYYYNPNVPVWILIILTTAIFIGMVSSGHEYIQLRGFRNNENKIVDKSYSFTAMLVVRYLLLSVIQSLLLVLPSVYIIENSFHFVSLFLICFLLLYWGSLTGLLLSRFLKENSFVYLVIPLIIIPQLVFSGALIKFDNFNKLSGDNNEIPRVADFVPMRWASEAVITDFYCDNPYYSNLYRNRQLLYNYVYYRDYFLPEVEKINAVDSERAGRIINNEKNKSGFARYGVDYDYDSMKAFCAGKIEDCLKFEDSVFSVLQNLAESKFTYSNLAVEKVINNQNSTNLIIKTDDNFVRNYKLMYSLPDPENRTPRMFLRAYVTVYKHSFRTLYYNVFIIIVYNLLFISFLFMKDIFVCIKCFISEIFESK